MPVRIRASVETVDRESQPHRSRAIRLLAGFLLLGAVAFLLWSDRGFARYAMTGFFWQQTEGTVIDAGPDDSKPTVQFATPDGALRSFSEDYIRLCGTRRTFCFIRDFSTGQQVPVVYDPRAPTAAYIHDWALTANVISFFVEAGLGLLLALMMFAFIRRKPIQASVGISDEDQADEP